MFDVAAGLLTLLLPSTPSHHSQTPSHHSLAHHYPSICCHTRPTRPLRTTRRAPSSRTCHPLPSRLLLRVQPTRPHRCSAAHKRPSDQRLLISHPRAKEATANVYCQPHYARRINRRCAVVRLGQMSWTTSVLSCTEVSVST